MSQFNLEEALSSQELAQEILLLANPDDKLKFASHGGEAFTTAALIIQWMDSTISPGALFRQDKEGFEATGCKQLSDPKAIAGICSALEIRPNALSGVLARNKSVIFFSPQAVLIMAASTSRSIAENLCDMLGIGMEPRRIDKLLAIAKALNQSTPHPASAIPPPTIDEPGTVYTDASVDENRMKTVLAAYSPSRQEAIIQQHSVVMNSSDAEAQAILMGWKAFKPECIKTDSKGCADQWQSGKREFSAQGRFCALGQLPEALELAWVPREQNAIADLLSKKRTKFYSGRFRVHLDETGAVNHLEQLFADSDDRIVRGVQKIKSHAGRLREEIQGLEEDLTRKRARLQEAEENEAALMKAEEVLRGMS